MKHLLLALLLLSGAGQACDKPVANSSAAVDSLLRHIRIGTYPERWYVESVDTIGPKTCGHLSADCLVAGHEHPKHEVCFYCLKTDTTWAKKVQAWWTPKELKTLKKWLHQPWWTKRRGVEDK